MGEEAVSLQSPPGAEVASAELAGVDARLAAFTNRPRSRVTLWSGVRKQRLAMTGLIIVSIFAIIAVIGPYVAPYDPIDQDIKNRLQSPNSTHWLGTDDFGRDILSRLLYGARVSFEVGAIAVGIAGSLGVVLGMIAGYRRGWVDSILVLLMDVLFAFPAILLAITIITVLGNNLTNVMIAIAIVYMPTFMRVVRGAVLSVRSMPYVEAAVSIGTPTPRILVRHIFPNITAPLIVHASINFGFAVLAEASLAFLGLGNKAPAASWGSMIQSSYGYLRTAPWMAIVPGTAIALTVLGFNLLGDGLRDALDPRLRTS
ncbi:MAG: ABC transporter permease [Thermomicrobiales bacterium]